MTWIKTSEKPPTAKEAGQQLDVLMWSPEWATFMRGMVTLFQDGLEWAVYDQQNDKYYTWDFSPEYYMIVELPQ